MAREQQRMPGQMGDVGHLGEALVAAQRVHRAARRRRCGRARACRPSRAVPRRTRSPGAVAGVAICVLTSSDVEQHGGPPAALGRSLDRQLVVGDRLDLAQQGVALSVERLAAADVAVRSPRGTWAAPGPPSWLAGLSIVHLAAAPRRTPRSRTGRAPRRGATRSASAQPGARDRRWSRSRPGSKPSSSATWS